MEGVQATSSRRSAAIVSIAALLLIGAGCFSKPSPPSPPPPQPSVNRPVACTDEAKQCPDGSYVGRTGPNCEFAPCPTGKVVCPEDIKLCPGGTAVRRFPPECKFADCPPEHWP